MTTNVRPHVMIEEWLPIATIGAESLRDASAAQKPPLNRLHIWWARRPLTTSRAAILASLLPAWSETWPASLLKQFQSRDDYQQWFVRLLGIFGDPARTRRAIAHARKEQIDLGPDPFGYKRAFTYNPDPEQLATLQALLKHAWGTSDLSVLDPMAGGGSIPFESLRYGFRTYSNDLNPVAALIEKATLDFPFRLELDVAVVQMDERTERQQNVFLNNPAAQGFWHEELLEKLIRSDGFDPLAAGFDKVELSTLLDAPDLSPMFAEGQQSQEAQELAREAREVAEEVAALAKGAPEAEDEDEDEPDGEHEGPGPAGPDPGMLDRRREHAAKARARDDTGHILVVVFADRAARDAFVVKAGGDVSSQYLDAGRLLGLMKQ